MQKEQCKPLLVAQKNNSDDPRLSRQQTHRPATAKFTAQTRITGGVVGRMDTIIQEIS